MKNQFNFCIKSILSVIILVGLTSGSKKDDYKDKSLTIEQRVEDLLSKMTLEEKIAQLAGHGLSSDDNTRLGIPGFKMSDGPLGVRTGKSTAFPAGITMAASWDTALLAKVGRAIAFEAKNKGLNMMLGPCVDIHRFPSGGRNFESYGEDPYLSSRLGVSFVKGMQENKNMIACVKHLAAENTQWEREKLNSVISERALHEIFFPPYQSALMEGEALSVMASYNKVNGSFGTENKYFLTDILKKNWGFKGFVISDWDATHNTLAAANAGLDLEMPQPVHFGDSLVAAVKSGKVSEELVNDKVRRILYAKFKIGLFDQPSVIDTSKGNLPEHRRLAKEAAKQGIVLLKNKNEILPIKINEIKSIAVIGPNAAKCRVNGGGSSQVIPYYSVSPLEGIKKRAGKNIKINYALGDVLDKAEVKAIAPKFFFTDESKKVAGLKAEYFNNTELKGKPELERIDKNVDFDFLDGSPGPGIGKDNFSIRWSGVLTSPVPAKFKIATYSDDGVRLYIDDKLQFENWDFHGTEKDSVEIFLDQNKPHKIRMEYFDGQMNGNIKLTWDYGTESSNTNSSALIKEATEAAKKSDLAIVFVGLADFLEGEAKDVNENLRLPNNQDALIKAVALANPKTIVVLNGGVALYAGEWINDVAGFIDAFYLGQETGNALAEVIFGDYNPSGKLPFTYLAKKSDSPAYDGYKSVEHEMEYKEGIYVGYRYFDKNNISPLYPFGFGLSYTKFEYSDLKISPGSSNRFAVTMNVKNTGRAEGAEVVQLYVKDIESMLDRPEKELKGFVKVNLKPGASENISFVLDEKAFQYFNDKQMKWVLEPGDFEIMIGSSSRDIKMRKHLSVK